MLSDTAFQDDESESFEPIRRVFDRQRVNLEPHQLILLYKNGTRQCNVTNAGESFRTVIDYLKLFDNNDELQQYLEQTQDKSTFIVSFGPPSKELISLVQNVKNLEAIYFYICEDEPCIEQRDFNVLKVCTKQAL